MPADERQRRDKWTRELREGALVLMQTVEPLALADHDIRTTVEEIYQLVPHDLRLADSGALRLYSETRMGSAADGESRGSHSIH